MSRYEVLALHYEREQERAYSRYLDARRLQELEYLRGVMTPAEYHSLSDEVEQHRGDYLEAQASGWPTYRQAEEAAQLAAVLRRNLATTKRKLQASVAFRELLASYTPALTFDTLPPLERRSVSISAHGPPSGPASRHGAPLGIT